MAEITLNKRKIQDAVRVATHAVAQEVGALSPAEALIAFAEVVGRVIAAQEGTAVLHRDMIKLAMEHIETTVRAGYVSKGKQAGALDGD
jgi:hypothetical protein